MKNYKVTIQIKTNVEPAEDKLVFETREFYVTAENKLQAEHKSTNQLPTDELEKVWDVDVNELNVTNPDTVIHIPTVEKTKEQLLIEALLGNSSVMEILKEHLGSEVYTSDDGVEVDGEKYYNESYINDLIDNLKDEVTGEIECYEFEVSNAEFEIRNGNEIEITSSEVDTDFLLRTMRGIFDNAQI